MRLFRAVEGFKIMQFDLSSVEPRIITQLSQDTTLLSVYGKTANPDADIYLTTGAKLSLFKDNILKYYSPSNPTAEGVKQAKLHCNTERKRSKTIFLGYIYGMRAPTLANREGMPLHEAEVVINDMDVAYSGLVRLGQRLKVEWAKNGGYVINARGIPMCVDRKYIKDLQSRVVQSSGVMLLRRLTQTLIPHFLKEEKIEWKPFIPNYHDEALILIEPGAEEETKGAVDKAFDYLNSELNWDVEIKHGGITFGNDLSIRCEV
jgi:hypothetical protein